MLESTSNRCVNLKHIRNFNDLDKYPNHAMFKLSSNIKWLRERSSEDVIEKSVNSVIDSKNKSIVIRPKYLFAESKLNQIYKLKDLFREFDQDNSSIT